MTLTTFRQKCFCVSVSALISVCVVLVIVLMLRTKETTTEQQQQQQQKQHHEQKYKIKTDPADRTYLEDLASDVEYTTPIKISTMLKIHQPNYTKLNLSDWNEEDFPPAYLRHDSGHFRDRFKSDVWDYRPRYRIYAFGHQLELDLQLDDTFIAPNLNINYKRENYTERIKHDSKATLRRCYYSGMVKGDANSAISVSLCNGMIGIIKTSNYTYYIEPAQPHVSSSPIGSNSFLHRIKRLPHHDMNNDIDNVQNPYKFANDIDDDQIIPSSQDWGDSHHPNHIINKRNVLFYDDIDEKKHHLSRNIRDVDYSRYDDRKSNTYFIKILVVADKSMVDFHQSAKVLEHYLLVLMSYAARLYKDPSIGNSLSLTVASIWILNEIEFTSLNSQDMLRTFCEWQATQQQTLSHQHDMALLLTRNQICRRNSTAECDTLGIAEVGSMCNPSSGCAIVKENGLSTSYTIAHEVGHVLNMPHDNTASCQKYNRNGGPSSYNNIMTKVMNNGTKPRSWSECSRHYVTDFLLSHRAKCLIDPPATNYITSNFTQNLPGENFTIDRQCELEFGHTYRGCTFANFKPCKMLWCTNDENSGCTSNQLPWADGTVCGPNQWCNQNECTSRRLLAPVAGGWGPWQQWSECSRTCGGGIRHSKRNCDSPLPQNGGQYCTGYGVKHESCNTEDCPKGEPDFRSVQCARFNGITRNFPNLTNGVQWLPDYNLASYDICKLYCKPKNTNLSYLLKEKVIDGTKCGLNSFDICIDGYCKPGGCDNKLYSTITFDDCGVCGGDNSKCQTIFGEYNKIESGYRRVTEIPIGSFNLDIRQNANNDTNYLVLKDIQTGDYILNSETMISPQEKDFIFGDVNISYSGASAFIERITTPRNHKLTKPLELGVLSVGDLQPPNITFGYTMNQDNAPKFGWRLYKKEWSKCDALCFGNQYMDPICVDLVTGQKQPDHYCSVTDREIHRQKQLCNQHCHLRWEVYSYGPCSVNCGKGIRNIYYNCVKINLQQTYQEVVHENHCNLLPAPIPIETCHGHRCDSTHWEYSDWSTCNTTCGGGYQTRNAHCVDSDRRNVDISLCSQPELITEQVCNTHKCPVWISRGWTPCSSTCGKGYRLSLGYYCQLGGRLFNDSACDKSTKPPNKEECFERPCAMWKVGNWSQCSTSCRTGFKSRTVTCVADNQPIPDEFCRDILRPEMTIECKGFECNKRHVNSYQWVPLNWNECSKSCGNGQRSQRFICQNDMGEINENMCRHLEKPIIVQTCNTHPCPQWYPGTWNNCDRNCIKTRLVNCINHLREYINDSYCNPNTKPPTTSSCQNCQKRLPTYKWVAKQWKPCSTTCGRGHKRRHIECQDTYHNATFVDQYCSHLKKPRDVKKCERYNCSMVWIEGPWSQCSTHCGRGHRYRNVTCHQVYPRRVVDPTALEMDRSRTREFCNLFEKPMGSMECQEEKCGDDFVWRTGQWSECSHGCGKKGRQVRDVFCVYVRTGQRVAKSRCPKGARPRRKIKCNQWRCLFTSCKEIQTRTGSRTNGDYAIWLHKRSAQIYCYKMDTTEPEEYISLSADAENYSENYNKRLKNPNWCPYDGQRFDNCDCLEIGPDRSGTTTFWKVRLNITSMVINGKDFTFSRQTKTGLKVPFGTAGDCYSSIKGCSQGIFSIDLSGTSFRLTPNVKWRKIGNNATVTIDFNDRQRVFGRCGGYCGTCVPDLSVGLQVEVT